MTEISPSPLTFANDIHPPTYSSINPQPTAPMIEKDIKSSNAPLSSSTSTTQSVFDASCSDFHPGATFNISARGIALLRLPVPSSELQIPITRSDGSLAYTSVRSQRWKGDAILRRHQPNSHDSDNGVDVIQTKYFFGPGREPILELLDPTQPSLSEEKEFTTSLTHDSSEHKIKAHGKVLTRATRFTMPGGRIFEWSYVKGSGGCCGRSKVGNIMVLRMLGPDVGSEIRGTEKAKDRENSKIIAQLVRNDETRTPGSSRSSAGNGGQLVLDEQASEYIEQAAIVATCLMMLKKEIDRRRCLQFVILGAIASGGP